MVGIGIVAYLLKKYGAKPFEALAYDADPTDVQAPDIISEDNIAQIAQQIALEELQYITDIQLAMNEKLTQAQNAQVEVVKFQTQVDDLKLQISTETNRIINTHDPLINTASIALDNAKQFESEKYSEYIIVENNYNDKIAQEIAWQKRVDEFRITIGYDLWKLEEVRKEKAVIELEKNNSWLIYLDSQNAREQELNDYNSALLAKENDSTHLDQLKRELIASTDSLNTWKIAYQAATNVYNELTNRLAIEQGTGALSTYYDSVEYQNWMYAPVGDSLKFILESIGSTRTLSKFNYNEAIAIVNEWNANNGALVSSLSWVRGF